MHGAHEICFSGTFFCDGKELPKDGPFFGDFWNPLRKMSTLKEFGA